MRCTGIQVPANLQAQGSVGLNMNLLRDVEDLDKYQPGGYHHLRPGDGLNNHYRLVDKLGHGGYSTIWLARDLLKARYVAVEVTTANSDCDEARLLGSLGNSPSKPEK